MSAHCIPGAAWSGQRLRCEPPPNKNECALRPWGCVVWPEAPLRATSKEQRVRTAPLGLCGLARGSAASFLKTSESAHCAPGAAWSGQRLRCEPPPKMNECALRPWGCLIWPEAPLRAISKTESAHCVPGAAWSGQRLRCEPPQKKGECTVHPRGCVVWPEAPLRAT